MYTKRQFGKELKEMVVKQENIAAIGAWAHDKYYEHMSEIDSNSGLRKFLLQLGTMEMGPEFQYSYEELEDVANRLIAGEDINL